MWTRGGVKTGYSNIFLNISPSSLSFMFIFAAWINACVIVLVYMIASLKESFCVLFCVFRNFRCELDLNFCKNLLSKSSKFCSIIIIMHLNGQQLEVKTLLFFSVSDFIYCVGFVLKQLIMSANPE